jgi:hypothetical protein
MSSNAPWREVEFELTSDRDYLKPYLEVNVIATFTDKSGQKITRPGFWDGGRTWRIRFAAPTATEWTWCSTSNTHDRGLQNGGAFTTVQPSSPTGNRFYDNGFWKMSAKGRSLVHADNSPAILAGDTAWALPWRATLDQVKVYAADRSKKGFNAALMMVVQPDKFAVGPRDRSADEGFDVGFEDLPEGHINEIRPEFFQIFDSLTAELAAHGIASVLQPVFHGYGWKGLETAGPGLNSEEAARFATYLVARYGARPVIYLVGADGLGNEPSIEAAGIAVEANDYYKQPTGIHYRPHAKAHQHQNAPWLDFQWCQTGHIGEHLPDRVADMYRNFPSKAVANGEPSYENGGKDGRASGWWQGYEIWNNIMSGAIMGGVYGAGSLWQWAHRGDETGQSDFFLAPGCGWREALDFKGSEYFGLAQKILGRLPITDAITAWELTIGSRGIQVPGKIFISFQEVGGAFLLIDESIPRFYQIINPMTGQVLAEGERKGVRGEVTADTGEGPRVYIFTSTKLSPSR